MVVCVDYVKGRERDKVCVCVDYVKGRVRGTERESVCVDYVKGLHKGTEWVCVCRLCERKREGDRVCVRVCLYSQCMLSVLKTANTRNMLLSHNSIRKCYFLKHKQT